MVCTFSRNYCLAVIFQVDKVTLHVHSYFIHWCFQGLLYLQQDRGLQLDLVDQMGQEDPEHKQKNICYCTPGNNFLYYFVIFLKVTKE